MPDRFAAQLLAGEPARDPLAVVERLVVVQAQDPLGFRLAVRARSEGLTAADVERALAERALVVTWLNRGTLQLVRVEDYPWLQALTTPRRATGVLRRLAQEGIAGAAAERAVRAIERALAEEGPLTRAQLRERVRVEGQALVHVLFLAAIRGLVVRGPAVSRREQAYVLVRDWLGEQPHVDRDAALRELGRRYLAAHAPADERDLASWAGLPLRDARAALRDAPEPAAAAAEPPPRLLGPYDELLLGWADRGWVVGAHRELVTVNGLFRPFALVGGRAVATWRLRGGELELAPFASLRAADEAALAREAEDVRRFLGQGVMPSS